ncbi:phage adaptor protein [Mesorhizobium onobrychidis]|uniref:Head completion adaptor n=1 Tax=Mesorhizobium onobrychidis TaxID=2775404 RepID=A0ABY5QU35_9HYPH|nr:hypothetical protein [Mesorhizobium onobrychidis]UVC14706.1 hypothetical protein IHQ72_29505 [Mesorhizobium onobrychidis]
MSRVLKAKEICERALRLIGKFPTTESAPDGEDLREAMFWLDLIMAQVAGTTRLFFLIPASITLTLVAGQQAYLLSDEIEEFPDNGFQFPVAAWLEDADGNRTPLTIVARDTWLEKSKLSTTGTPCEVYIDRLPDPTLYTYPTIEATDTDVYTIVLDFQSYAPNVAPGGVSGTRPEGTVETLFRQAWQRWLVYKLAVDIGGGAVVKLPEQSLARFEREELKAFSGLEAFENREHDTESPTTEPFGMEDC